MDVAQECSFVRFVYPFEFKDRNFKDIQQSVGTPPWRSGSGPVWEKHAFHDQDFLPHIADFFQLRCEGPGDGRRLEDVQRRHGFP